MTERQLDGKVAIVTGGSRGIGRAIAERFAAEGAKVVVNHVSGSGAADAVVAAIKAAGGEAIAVRADVSKSADVAALMAAAVGQYGRIDILVNNAGVMFTKPMLETTEDEWNQTIATNLTGPYLCSKAVAPIMTSQGAGTIINMSSNSGLYHPSAMRFTEYVVSKAGLNGLTKAMALAFGPEIRVNAICPGWIRTEMVGHIDETVQQRILDESPLRRWGTPSDIASAAVYLASDESSFVTGELHLVAGGRGMH